MSPLCIWLSPGDLQCDWKPENRSQVRNWNLYFCPICPGVMSTKNTWQLPAKSWHRSQYKLKNTFEIVPRSTVLLSQVKKNFTINPCDAFQPSANSNAFIWRENTSAPARCVAASITEPLLAGIAVHNTCWVMDTTVAAEKSNKTSKWLLHFVNSLQ